MLDGSVIAQSPNQCQRSGSSMGIHKQVNSFGVARDFRVDVIRGLVLVVMTWSHLPEWSLRHWIVQPFGIVNAAEVFVFASGLVSAWLMGKLLWAKGARAVFRRALTRAGQLYLTHLSMFALFLWTAGKGLIHAPLPAHSNPVRLLLRILTFKLQPTFLDILPMYVFFVLAAPIVLMQLAKGRAGLVASLSFGLWAASWYVSSAAHYTFNILAWQLMFVSGMIAGYWRLERGRSTSLPKPVIALSWTLCAVFFLLRHSSVFHLVLPVEVNQILARTIDERHLLLPLRLLSFAAMVIAVISIPRTVDRLIPSALYRAVALIGQSSLQVYAWTVVLAYIARTKFVSWERLTAAEQTGIAALFALSLFLPVLLHRAWRRSLKSSQRKRPLSVSNVLLPPAEAAKKSAVAGARA